MLGAFPLECLKQLASRLGDFGLRLEENIGLVTLMSGLFSGLVVAVAQYVITQRDKKREARLSLIAEIVGYRYVLSNGPYTEEDTTRFFSALNKVPVYFHDRRDLLDAYRDLKNNFTSDKFARFVRLLLREAGVRRSEIDDAVIETPLVLRFPASPSNGLADRERQTKSGQSPS